MGVHYTSKGKHCIHTTTQIQIHHAINNESQHHTSQIRATTHFANQQHSKGHNPMKYLTILY